MQPSEESSPPGVESSSHLSTQETEPPMEAGTEGTPLSALDGNITVSPEEDDLLTGDQTHAESQNPTGSVDTASMAGEMAKLHVSSPPRQEPEDDEIGATSSSTCY